MADDIWFGPGETGQLLRGMSSSLLGEPESWPVSLKSALSICLGSRFPMAIYWGDDLTLLYNDAWAPILGSKHPWALGRSAREVWPEIWDSIGPLFEQVRATGDSTYSEDSLLLMHRHGYTEECYFNFTFTPIRGAMGAVEGVFNAVIETTYRVLDERRTAVLRRVGEALTSARSAPQVCALAASALTPPPVDVPFCAFFLAERPDELVASAHAPALTLDEVTTLSLGALRDAGVVPPEPTGPAPSPSKTLVVKSLDAAGQRQGQVVFGINPRRALDQNYARFLDDLAGTVAASIAASKAFELERRRAEGLAELDRAKTAFFSSVSHEFRTPLTLLLGPTEDALATPNGAISGDALRSLHRNELRLLKLVNSLLEFSRFEAVRVDPQLRETNLAALTSDLAATFQGVIERAGLTLRVTHGAEPAWARVDRDVWERIVFNLLSNALKFTFEGSIEVRVDRVGSAVELRVKDTGIGIAAEDLVRLFERFQRVEGARSRSHEGSGIGLALVQEQVRVLGGSIRVESEPGKGSEFIVTLPAVAASSSAAVPAHHLGTTAHAFVAEAERWLVPPKTPRPASVASDRVLVVEDNADMRDYVTRILESHWQVSSVADGDAALRHLRTTPVDLVLTDVMMPKLDGFALLRTLRSDPRLKQLPVIMLSARAGEEASVEGLQAGADDYLIKPFTARELLARVSARLELSRTRAEVERARSRLRSHLEQAPVPIAVMMGSELRFEVANPPLERMIGGRAVLGQTFDQAFPELLGSPVRQLLDRVFSTGEAFRANEFLISFDRERNGALSDGHFQFSLEPLKDEQDNVEGVMAVAIDVSAQVATRTALEKEQRRLASIVDELPIAFTLTNRDGLITHVNRALGRLWRMDTPSRIARGEYDVFVAYHSDGRPYEGADWPNLQVLESGQALHRDAVRFTRFDGSEGFMRIDGVPLLDEHGQLSEALVTSVDVTSEVRAAEALETARQEAERASRVKDEFLAMLGHELRNPLSPIATALHLLSLKGRAEPELAVIQRQVSHLTRLVDDLLDVSRITRGKVELRRKRVEMHSVVARAVEMAAPLLEANRQTLVLDVAEHGLDVDGDPDRLAQVVSNLLTNASKYSPAGAKVEVSAKATDDIVQLHVTDNGHGIADDMIERVFDLFFQERQPIDRQRGGLGLGLAIVRSLVQLHGGRVHVASKGLGQGSTFSVELPRAKATAAGSSPRASLPPLLTHPRAATHKVLVVDDNADAGEMLAEALRERGHVVLFVNDAASALVLLETFSPDVCLLDLGLPVMNGFELASRIRGMTRLARVRLIAVTGYGQVADVRRSREAGFDAHFVKPVDLPAILAAVERPLDAASVRAE